MTKTPPKLLVTFNLDSPSQSLCHELNVCQDHQSYPRDNFDRLRSVNVNKARSQEKTAHLNPQYMLID